MSENPPIKCLLHDSFTCAKIVSMPISIADLELALNTFHKKHPTIKVLGYFGSYAKNSAKPQSDVDICIAEERPLSSEVKIAYANELTLLLNKEVDLLDLKASTGTILKEALVHGKWIAKETTTYGQILSKMLFDQADFQPYYQRMLKAKRERFLKS